MKLQELATRITAHLKRFESDARINAPRPAFAGTRPYYNAHASAAGSRVSVVYVLYQGGTTLTKSQAEAYLAWLDAGNVGRHQEALR